jgi:hypothetical protein
VRLHGDVDLRELLVDQVEQVHAHAAVVLEDERAVVALVERAAVPLGVEDEGDGPAQAGDGVRGHALIARVV